MKIWHVDVDRIRLDGVSTEGLEDGELRALVEAALRDKFETASLPHGRAVTVSVRVDVPPLAGGAEIAKAVADSVARAVGGRARG